MEINSRNVFDFLGQKWILFLAAGIIIFIVCGISVFSTPSYEIMYNHQVLPVVESERGDLHFHIFEIGNTGRKTQHKVDVSFSSDALSYSAMQPMVKNFGKVKREADIKESDETTVISLGVVEPGKRVEIHIVLFYQGNEIPHVWDEIFKGIEIFQGEAVEGDPGWTTVARMLFAIFG